MVFNRRHEPTRSDFGGPQVKQPDRPVMSDGLHIAEAGSFELNDSYIGKDLSIEGQTITIRCKGALKVNGNIQADVHSHELEIGRDGIISGQIAADTVNVYGRVNGAILGQKVVLHATAEVEGDIHSQFLSIEHGAAFDGRSRRVKNPAEVAPQLERTTGGPAAHSSVHQTQPPPPPHVVHSATPQGSNGFDRPAAAPVSMPGVSMPGTGALPN